MRKREQGGQGIKKPKERGEWAELLFMLRGAEHELKVGKPWGDSARYDVSVEYKGKFQRVQVKCTMAQFKGGGYICTFSHTGMAPYTVDDVDFFAIYVIPEDVWYIIPAEVATKHSHNILLNPGRKGQRYERYIEAWDLLKGDVDLEREWGKELVIG